MIMKKRLDVSQVLIGIALTVIALLVIYPLYYTFMVSISNYQDVLHSGIFIKNTGLCFDSYTTIFELTDIGHGLLVSFFVTIIGTTVNLVVCISGAYALSKKRLPGHKFFMLLIIFCMLFDGGLIPFYLTVKKLNLVDNFFAMVFPVAVNFFYLFILINHFRSIPASLEESAYMDGANEITILLKILVPVSIPTICAIGLFFAVDRWNEWWNAMIFISNDKLHPLQLMLRGLITNIERLMGDNSASSFTETYSSIFTPGLKMAAVVISTVPILCVYPYLSKHFTKGVMVGSIKG